VTDEKALKKASAEDAAGKLKHSVSSVSTLPKTNRKITETIV
jgi:hypothetical protein